MMVKVPATFACVLSFGFLALASTGCGNGTSMTAPNPTGSTGTPSGSAGTCQVTCSDYSTSAFVVIAVSPSSLVCGSAANVSTLDDAKKRAVAACGRSDCVPVIWGRNGVAAVAVDRVAYGWGWAVNASSTADSKAIAMCESRSH